MTFQDLVWGCFGLFGIILATLIAMIILIQIAKIYQKIRFKMLFSQWPVGNKDKHIKELQFYTLVNPTLRALAHELNRDLDAKEALYEAITENHMDVQRALAEKKQVLAKVKHHTRAFSNACWVASNFYKSISKDYRYYL